jgi:hypothetical protein
MKILVALLIALRSLHGAAIATGHAEVKARRNSATALEPATYGPAGCVSLGRSPIGSCTIATNCEGKDISKFEFAFDCESKTGSIVRHSFGTGGFEDNEDFDTEVLCKTCYVPSPWAVKDDTKIKSTAKPVKQLPSWPSKAPPTSTRKSDEASAPDIVAAVVEAAAESDESLKEAEKRAEVAEEEAAKKAAEEKKAAIKAAEEQELAKKAAAEAETAARRAAEEKKHLEAAEKARAAAEEKRKQQEQLQKQQEQQEQQQHKSKVETNQEPTQQSEAAAGMSAVRFGPRKCVSTYRSQDGHCILQTKCDPSDIKNYEFGLVCVDNGGSSVRHLFGQDSFDAEETFDTLITCEKCLGLQDTTSDASLAGRVTALSNEVDGLKVALVNITNDIQELNKTILSSRDEGVAALMPMKRNLRSTPQQKIRADHARRALSDDSDLRRRSNDLSAATSKSLQPKVHPKRSLRHAAAKHHVQTQEQVAPPQVMEKEEQVSGDEEEDVIEGPNEVVLHSSGDEGDSSSGDVSEDSSSDASDNTEEEDSSEQRDDGEEEEEAPESSIPADEAGP